MKTISKLLVIVFVMLLLAPAGQSQAANGIGLTPAIEEVELSEGSESVSFEVGISNSTSETVDLGLSTLDFGALDESGGIAFIGRTDQETTKYGLSQWMKLEKDRITLEPGQTQDVKVTIANREGLSPGGHYGAVVVSAALPDGSDPNSLSVIPAASTLVFLKKTGGEIRQLELESVNTNSSLINLPNSVTLRFQNTGNIHLVPRGTVELISPTGSIISRGVINQQSSFVLPESFRQFKVDFTSTSQPWLPGRYSIKTTWRYDGEDKTQITIKHYFYLGRITIILLIAISALIVLFMFRKWRKNPIIRGR